MSTVIYNTIQHLSNKNHKLFESFGDVLKHIMRSRGKNQSWIAKKTGKDKKQISEYVNNKTTPFNDTQQEIADALGVFLEQIEGGKWKLFDPEDSNRPTVEEMIDRYKSRKEQRDFSDNEKDLLYEVLLENAESLAVNLRRLIEIEKNRSE